MFDSLYENIGSKIKNWAKWIFITEAIAAIITGIALLINMGFEDAWWALFIIFFGPAFALVSTYVLYAFGELVEDVHAMRKNNHKQPQSKSSLSQDEMIKNAKKEYKNTIKTQKQYGSTTTHEQYDDSGFSVPQIKCPKCGIEHDFDYPKCPNCKHKYNL